MTALDVLCGWLNPAAMKTVLHSNCEQSGRVARRDVSIGRHDGAPQAACFQQPVILEKKPMSRLLHGMGWLRDARVWVEGIHAGVRPPLVPCTMG